MNGLLSNEGSYLAKCFLYFFPLVNTHFTWHNSNNFCGFICGEREYHIVIFPRLFVLIVMCIWNAMERM